MTATEDRELRRALHSTLQSVQPSPAPVEAIIRRGRHIRLRRARAAVAALGVAAVVAVTAMALHGSPQPASPTSSASVPGGRVVPGGVFARGTADGHSWQLSVQDIADPGYTCVPAITINGTDADPLSPDPSGGAAVTLGPADPGTGFAYLIAPADIKEFSVNGGLVQPVTATACGIQYRLVGFAYPVTGMLRITAILTSGGRQAVLTVAAATTVPQPTAATPQVDGIWDNKDSSPVVTNPFTVASGTLSGGQGWTIMVQFGTAGDCYDFEGTTTLRTSQIRYCGPVSTPDGPETIMALPLAFPDPGTGATGYAVQVSPVTDALEATLSNGSSEMATFCVVDGRTYAAFVVPYPLRLATLTWFDARGRAIADTTALPQFGYVQFGP
jgi:hypothetical protein